MIHKAKDAPVALMPESEGDALCFEFSSMITLDSYNLVMKNVRERVGENGMFSLLFYYTPSFKGWEPEAADANMKNIIEYGRNTRRLAYVNPPEKKIMQHKMAPGLFSGEVKYFSEEQLAEAIAWVKG